MMKKPGSVKPRKRSQNPLRRRSTEYTIQTDRGPVKCAATSVKDAEQKLIKDGYQIVKLAQY